MGSDSTRGRRRRGGKKDRDRVYARVAAELVPILGELEAAKRAIDAFRNRPEIDAFAPADRTARLAWIMAMATRLLPEFGDQGKASAEEFLTELVAGRLRG